VSDIFNEVSEEVRREQFKKLWDKHGYLILGAAFLVVAGVGGWRGYEWYQARKAAEAGAAFQAAVTLSDQDKGAEAQASFAKIAAESSRSYQMLARLREAAETAKRDPQAAVKLYDSVASDTGVAEPFRDSAVLRAAALQLDTQPYADIRAKLAPLTATGRAFRHSARELLALSAWRAKDDAATREWLNAIISDSESPTNLRSRAEALLALLPPVAKG
jgi:hypothetical protein